MLLLTQRKLILIWTALSVTAITGAILFSWFSHRFNYDYTVSQMPVWVLIYVLCGAGLLFIVICCLVALQRSATLPIISIILITGVIIRLILFTSEPVLEDDYQRYFWDGAVTANGINPYRYAPAEISELSKSNANFARLSKEAGVVLKRINHPELRTIYPPVAQAAFAVSYVIKPFSLTAWRGLLLICDIATCLLLLKLLLHFRISLVWVSLYWWNPVVIKELFNSAHMDAVMLPFLVGGIYLAIKQRFAWSGISLMLAAGVKIWPIALMAIVFRPLLTRPKSLFIALTPVLVLGLLFAWPIVITTLDKTSGFIAYATAWKTNSALFPLLTYSYSWLLNTAGLGTTYVELIVRSSIVVVMALIMLALFIPKIGDDKDLVRRCFLAALAIFLLSPAQFPWYYVWVAPFLVFFPVPALILLTVTMPLYYTAFYYFSQGSPGYYLNGIIWIIWLPVWLLLIFDTYRLKILRFQLHPNILRSCVTKN